MVKLFLYIYIYIYQTITTDLKESIKTREMPFGIQFIWYTYIYIYYRYFNETYSPFIDRDFLTLYGKSESFMSAIYFFLSFYIFKKFEKIS